MTKFWLAAAIPAVLGLAISSASVGAADAPGMDMGTKHPEGKQCRGMKEMMDADKDGKISKDEFIKHHEEMFSHMDKNGDGQLDDSETQHGKEMMHKSRHGGKHHK